MSNYISIHKAKFHKAYALEDEENLDLMWAMYLSLKFIIPIKDKDFFYLYDIENNKLLKKNKDIESLQIDINTEVVRLIGVSVDDFLKIIIPEKTKKLIFEGGDLMPIQMSKTKQADDLWKKVNNYLNLFKISETTDERVLFEGKLRSIYNNEIPKNISDFGLGSLFQKLANDSITDFLIGWTYISDNDFKLLSELNHLEKLSIFCCYNDNLERLPKNLTFLKIFGTTIQSLSKIKLNIPNLKTLELEENTINCLDNLLELPRTLEYLNLRSNLIESFRITDLPDDLEKLDLSKNFIDNGFFNQKVVCKNLKTLMLNDNKLLITSSILQLILEIFPNLKHLELIGNEVNGVPVKFIGDFDNINCIENVRMFLGELDEKKNHHLLSITKSEELIDFVDIKWKERLLPLKFILSEVQDCFSIYFKEMPFFKLYSNGLSCFIEHDNCELYIKFEEKTKLINLKIRSNDAGIVADYFHKYFSDLYLIINYYTHVNILPRVTSSESCKFLKDFCFEAFKLNKVNSKPVLIQKSDSFDLLINKRKKGTDLKGKYGGVVHKNIDLIAFIIISGKSAFPFVINEKRYLTNQHKTHKGYYHSVPLRNADEKEAYKRGITNKYLNNSRLKEAEVFVDNSLGKMVSCFVNTKYFHVDEYDLKLSEGPQESPKLSENHLIEIDLGKGKLCKFSVVDNCIKLNYI